MGTFKNDKEDIVSKNDDKNESTTSSMRDHKLHKSNTQDNGENV